MMIRLIRVRIISTHRERRGIAGFLYQPKNAARVRLTLVGLIEPLGTL